MFNSKGTIAVLVILFSLSAFGQEVKGWETASQEVVAPATPTTTATQQAVTTPVTPLPAQTKEQPVKKAGSFSDICTNPQTVEDKAICRRAAQIEAEKSAKVARAEKEKKATPAEKQAMKEMAKVKKRQNEALKEMRDAFLQANVQGCKPGSVIVTPFVTHFYNGNGPWLEVTVYNKSLNTVDISSGKWTWIRNLCPGGSATFVRPFVSGEVPDQTFVLVARNTKGQTAHSQEYLLSVNNYYHRQERWDIDLLN